MKRDDEYLRQILLEVEDQEDFLLLVRKVMAASANDRRKQYHVELLCDAGLMSQVSESGYRMTSAGHDYLDAIRSEGIWNKTKEAVAETGGSVPLEIMKQLAKGFLKKKIERHTGIELE